MNNRLVTIVTPCFNENITVIKFLKSLEVVLSEEVRYDFIVVVVDDCSTDNTLELLEEFRFRSANISLNLLTLNYNLGHQGAIYQGLCFAQTIEQCDTFIVMDSDGEDDPKAIKLLLASNDHDVIHVKRGKRSEGILFRALYQVYKSIFLVITNSKMNFGNYSKINKKTLIAIVAKGFIHYAANLSRLKVTFSYIIYDRGKRLDGESKMNLTSLLNHAFKSFVEYGENMLFVFLKLFISIIFLILGIIGYVLYQKIFTDNAILGWASTLTASLVNAGLICIGFFVIGIMLTNILNKDSLKQSKKIFRRIGD